MIIGILIRIFWTALAILVSSVHVNVDYVVYSSSLLCDDGDK